MNFQPLIDNAHWLVLALSLFVFALPGLFTALGKLIKGEDFFEKNAARVKWFADQFAAARNLYSEAEEKMGLPKVPGMDKAIEVEGLLMKAWGLWTSGKHAEALAALAAYQAGASDKAKKAGLLPPFPSRPSTTPSSQADTVTIGPNDPAQQ